MSFELGHTTGDYEFIDVLDSSKAGVTYKVRNVVAQRFEALKVLPRTWQEDQERIERFLRETKVHARLRHPNIVAFYNAGRLDSQMIMTTELVEGLTLEQVLEGGPLGISESVRYMVQALKALDYAHESGVVHREITPAHMIVTPEGTLKLTGFGLAKVANSPQLTQVGAVMGSLEYISPEQVKGASNLDGRADLYSLGVVFYQAVTGKLPFESASQFDLMLAHVNLTPRPPIELREDLPPEINDAILRALAKDPMERYRSARDFWQALEEVAPPAEAAKAEPEVEAPHPGIPTGAPVLPGFPPVAPATTWTTPQLMAAGIFLFLMMALAFYVVLTAARP